MSAMKLIKMLEERIDNSVESSESMNLLVDTYFEGVENGSIDGEIAMLTSCNSIYDHFFSKLMEVDFIFEELSFEIDYSPYVCYEKTLVGA